MEAVAAIQELRRIAQPILEKAGDTSVFPAHFTFRLVLERLESSLGSLELLLQNDALRHDHAVGLICRNVLSDALSTGYVIKLSSTVENLSQVEDDEADIATSSTMEKDLDNKLYALYYHDLRRTDSIVEIFKDAGLLSEDGLKQYKENQSMPGSIYRMIRDYGEKHKLKSFPSSTRIVKLLIEHLRDDKWSKELQRSYDPWVRYSKYEHLGLFSFELTRNLNEKDVNGSMRFVMRMAALLQSSCLEMLEQKEALEESIAVYEQLLPVTTNTLVAND